MSSNRSMERRWTSFGRVVAVGGLAVAGLTMAQSQQQTCTYTGDDGQVHSFPCPLNGTQGSQPATAPSGPPPSAAKQFPYPGESNSPAATPNSPPANQGSQGSSSSGDTSTSPANSNLPASKRFPYPGESNSSGGQNSQGSSPQTDSPAPSQNGSLPATKRFPYPGEAPDNSKPDPASQGLQDAGSSGSSSSSSSSSSSDTGSSSSSVLPALPLGPDDDTAADDAAAAEKRQARRKVPAAPKQTPDEREQEDVRVAAFYQNDGNYRGAYMRSQDAVTLDDSDPSAHLALAEAARKLGKFDEAQKQYKRCLELDPVPKDRKVAEKALKEMSGGA